MMQQPPPALPAYRVNLQDESHLHTISICHYVMAGFYLLGIGFVIVHFIIMSFVFRMAEAEQTMATSTPGTPIVVPSSPAPGDPSSVSGLPPTTTAPPVVTTPSGFPKEIIPIFIIFYIAIGVFLVALCVCNALSGYYIKKRKNRIFSFIIAGLNCMQFPLGTALGVFTFIVLTRESVKMSYSMNVRG